MKIRNGFVSNSSSSSFVCDVCGEQFSGMDLCMSDVDLWSCEHGHVFCDEHMNHSTFSNVENFRNFILTDLPYKLGMEDDELKDKYDGVSVADILKEVFESESDAEAYFEDEVLGNDDLRYELPTACCPICSMDIVSATDLVDYLMKITKITKLAVLTEIKKENKRRRKVYDGEYIEYACNSLDTDHKTVEKEIIAKFDSYDDFRDFLFG